MAIDTTALDRCWTMACAHAGLQPGQGLRLYYVPGDSGRAHGGIHLHPGSVAVRDRDWPFADNQLRDANRDDNRRNHRIAVRDCADEPTAVAVLRHELQHALQYQDSEASYALQGVAQDAAALALRERQPATLDGSALLYNLLPHEQDANRAASECVRAHFAEDVLEPLRRGPSGQLFRETDPPRLESLAPRLVALAAVFPETAAKAAKEFGGLSVLLHRVNPGLASWWANDRPGLRIEDYGQLALARIPRAQSVSAAAASGNAADAWTGVRDAVDDGATAAMKVLVGAGLAK